MSVAIVLIFHSICLLRIQRRGTNWRLYESLEHSLRAGIIITPLASKVWSRSEPRVRHRCFPMHDKASVSIMLTFACLHLKQARDYLLKLENHLRKNGRLAVNEASKAIERASCG